jgi:hypothetical protein
MIVFAWQQAQLIFEIREGFVWHDSQIYGIRRKI